LLRRSTYEESFPSTLTRARFLQASATAVAALSGAQILGGCGSTGSGAAGDAPAGGPPQRPTGTFRFPLEGATTGFDPAYSGALLSDYVVVHAIFDRLVAFDPAFTRLVPSLATGWEQSEDAREFTITLRDGVRFHDGEPLDAAALKATLQYMSTAAGAISGLLLPPRYDTLELVDALRLRVVTPAPQPDFIRNQAFLSVMSPKAIKAGGEALKRRPIGTGAYRFARRAGNGGALVVANNDYWGDGPYFEQIDFEVIADAGARINALLTRQVGMAYRLPPTQVQRVAGASGTRTVSGDVWSGVYVAFVCNKPPFDDVRVRRACAHAVDKEALIRAIARGQGRVADTFSPKGVLGYAPPAVRYEHDLEAARALMAAAGHADGFSAVMCVSTAQYLQPQLAQAVAGQLEQIGIRARVEVVDPIVQSRALLDPAQKAYDMFPTDWTWLTGGPLLQQAGTVQSASRYDGRDLTAPLAAMSVTPDGPRRDAAFAAFEGAFSRQVPILPLFQSIYNDGLQQDVGGYEETPKNGYGPNFFPMYTAA